MPKRSADSDLNKKDIKKPHPSEQDKVEKMKLRQEIKEHQEKIVDLMKSTEIDSLKHRINVMKESLKRIEAKLLLQRVAEAEKLLKITKE